MSTIVEEVDHNLNYLLLSQRILQNKYYRPVAGLQKGSPLKFLGNHSDRQLLKAQKIYL